MIFFIINDGNIAAFAKIEFLIENNVQTIGYPGFSSLINPIVNEAYCFHNHLVFNCFLAKNVTLDDSTLEIEKEKVHTFINKIRAYPINLFDDRVDWEILSVIRSKISDTMLSKIFKFAT